MVNNLTAVMDNDGTLNVYFNGTSHTIRTDHPEHGGILTFIEYWTDYVARGYNPEEEGMDLEELRELCHIPTVINNHFASSGGTGAIIQNGQVVFKGQPVHTLLANHIMELYRSGVKTFEHWLRFMENLDNNPSYRSREQLFNFLDRCGLHVTTDGCFLAYKAVQAPDSEGNLWSIGKDHNTGEHVRWNVGDTPEMNRRDVDDDSSNGCGAGLHVGSYDYARMFGGRNSGYVLVKVNPADVVSVPRDCQHQKLRCHKATVVQHWDGEAKLDKPMYENQSNDFWNEEDYECGDDEEVYLCD